MIKLEHTDVYGFEAAVRGMRNPLNSWDNSDSELELCTSCESYNFDVGKNDLALMHKLAHAGDDHGKFGRFINVTVDITAPLYWWKEFDIYKIGTVVNSCSTMHKIHEKEFTLEDFSHEHLLSVTNNDAGDALFLNDKDNIRVDGDDLLGLTINVLNYYRGRYIKQRTNGTGGNLSSFYRQATTNAERCNSIIKY